MFAPRVVAGVQLLPLAAMYDSTHVARLEWYTRAVFGAARCVALPRGCYLEDTLGQAQLADARARGAAALREAGTYLAHEGEAQARLVVHVSGRDSMTAREDWPKWCHVSAHTSDAAWAAAEAAGELNCDAQPRYALLPGFYDEEDAAAGCGGASADERDADGSDGEESSSEGDSSAAVHDHHAADEGAHEAAPPEAAASARRADDRG